MPDLGIAGTFEVLPRGKFIRRFAPIAIATGAPLMPADGESEEAFNRGLHDAIANQMRVAEGLHT